MLPCIRQHRRAKRYKEIENKFKKSVFSFHTNLIMKYNFYIVNNNNRIQHECIDETKEEEEEKNECGLRLSLTVFIMFGIVYMESRTLTLSWQHTNKSKNFYR